MQDSNTYNDYHEADVDLLPTFWNKDKEQAWRKDIAVDILTADDNNRDEETDSESEEEQYSESENEMDDDGNDSIFLEKTWK